MKRKASELDEGFSWSSQNTSAHQSSPSYDGFGGRHIDSRVGSFPASDTHMNVRTRKRTRDNRPQLEVIHQNTLAKLYDAQKHPQSSLVVGRSPADFMGEEIPQSNSIAPAQQSLHSFFSISHSQPPKASATASKAPSQYAQTCDDCGNILHSATPADSDMMDVDHNLELYLGEDYECTNCGRRVCDACAVRGDHRICLECAMPGGG